MTPSGPDGIGDHRTRHVEQSYVGHGSMSPESSSDTQYLYRSAPVREIMHALQGFLISFIFLSHSSLIPSTSYPHPFSLKTCPHPAPKSARVGEVGWGVPRLSDTSLLKSGNQIIVSSHHH